MYVTWSELIAFVAMLTAVAAFIIEIHKNKPSYPQKVNGLF